MCFSNRSRNVCGYFDSLHSTIANECHSLCHSCLRFPEDNEDIKIQRLNAKSEDLDLTTCDWLMA